MYILRVCIINVWKVFFRWKHKFGQNKCVHIHASCVVPYLFHMYVHTYIYIYNDYEKAKKNTPKEREREKVSFISFLSSLMVCCIGFFFPMGNKCFAKPLWTLYLFLFLFSFYVAGVARVCVCKFEREGKTYEHMNIHNIMVIRIAPGEEVQPVPGNPLLSF